MPLLLKILKHSSVIEPLSNRRLVTSTKKTLKLFKQPRKATKLGFILSILFSNEIQTININ